jgi:SAM-dependent methyltransferase
MGGQTVETLNYAGLADYYDQLVKDDEATLAWVDYTRKRVKGKHVLELACGSGEITLALADQGFAMSALDLSPEMVERASAKDTEKKVDFSVGNMLDLDRYADFDAILCYCDSINYLERKDLERFFKQVHGHLNDGGVFLFDMHTPERLAEFLEPYIEEDWIGDTAYQWAIESDDPKIIHHFRFYGKDGNIVSETHVQTVFDLKEVVDLLKKQGFSVELTTDFEGPSDQAAEKYFVCARKGEGT